MTVSHEQKHWCEETVLEKKDAIEAAKETQLQHTADLKDAEAKKATATQRAVDTKNEILSTDTELSELEKQFDADKGAHKKRMEELTTAAGDVEKSLFQSHSVVRRHGDAEVNKLRSLDSALLRDVSFLQLRNDEQTDPEQQAEVQSAEDMEKAQKQERAAWGQKQKESGELLKAKKAEISGLESDFESAQLAVANAEEQVATLTRGKSAAERTESREAALLITIENSCETTSTFFADQEAIRTEAAEKLDEAIDAVSTLQHTALTQFATSFLQLSSSAQDVPSEMALLDVAAGAADTVAATMSTGASLDPLADIKAKIQGMVQALEAAENAEKGPESFCSDEQAKNREKKRSKQDDIDRLAAEARSKGFELDGLLHSQRTAQAGLNGLSILKAHISSFQQVEAARLKGEKNDHDLAVEVLDKAAALVKEDYGLSLLQESTALSKQELAQKAVDAMQAANEKLRALSAAADVFLGKLEGAGNVEITEVESAMRSENQEMAQAKSGEATKQDEIAQAATSEQNARAELTVITTYLTNLAGQCGPSLGNSYEELKRQREEEIASLQDAIKVLEGEAVPTLSMAQVQHPSPVQQAALALGVA